MADGGKKNGKIDGKICRTLQSKKGRINQCGGIGATKDSQNPPSGERE